MNILNDAGEMDAAMREKIRKRFLLIELVECAHNFNVLYSDITDSKVPPKKKWLELLRKERKQRFELFERLIAEGKHQNTPQQSHEEWLKTADKNHPNFKPFEELPLSEQLKDSIYLHFLQLGALVNELEIKEID